MSPSLNQIAREAWECAEEAGWHDRPTTHYERIALIHSEASEALEAMRRGIPNMIDSGNPRGVGAELADIVIRTCELAYLLGIDLDFWTRTKQLYNRDRADVPRRSGGKSI